MSASASATPSPNVDELPPLPGACAQAEDVFVIVVTPASEESSDVVAPFEGAGVRGRRGGGPLSGSGVLSSSSSPPEPFGPGFPLVPPPLPPPPGSVLLVVGGFVPPSVSV